MMHGCVEEKKKKTNKLSQSCKQKSELKCNNKHLLLPFVVVAVFLWLIIPATN